MLVTSPARLESYQKLKEKDMIIWIIIAIAILVNACCISEEEYIKIQKAKDNAFIKYWNSWRHSSFADELSSKSGNEREARVVNEI